jgi:uncharacterized low-complexity protein
VGDDGAEDGEEGAGGDQDCGLDRRSEVAVAYDEGRCGVDDDTTKTVVVARLTALSIVVRAIRA